MEKMGDRIKRLRLEKNITQEDLAKIIGLKRSAIAKYENGIVENMKQTTIKTMADFFGVKPSYLMCIEDEDNNYFEYIAEDARMFPILDIPKGR